MTRHTIRADGEIDDLLQDADNKSELVREALRSHVDGPETDTDGLTDLQRRGLLTLLDLSMPTDGPAAGTIGKEVAESQLAQRTQIDSEAVVSRVIKPLMRAGYVRMEHGRQSLNVYETPRERVYDGADTEWTPVPQSGGAGCESKHGLLSAGTECPICGDEVTGDDADDDEQEGGEEPISLDTTATECETPGCTATLYGGVSTCWECRTGTEGSA
ncbi:hypothetical protein [Halorientalis litorea]|uniref:hypothetical protein n=1 Tax=Halorientalis litorea TaxID=2931977 RepID=UPI001FF5950F|nr:hypothetical protein [Halorientalis litorea]